MSRYGPETWLPRAVVGLLGALLLGLWWLVARLLGYR
jgi:hypothetical protein